ncbi:NUDIX domain-containing protein [Streptomyces pseudovenezuelae]|uniref:NUDIX domain-containing protein n=1 Tax=Streptomyces pseudovenezuelae TaxID=67350 RepID=UPI00371A7758
MVDVARTASVLLVDRKGRLLLQLRDDKAPLGRNKWAIPGGYLSVGESPAAAARREIREETGLIVDDSLEIFWRGRRSFGPALGNAEWNVYCAATQAVPEDVVVGEGTAIEFLAPAKIEILPLVSNARFFVRMFLVSAQYERLRDC